MTDKHHQAFNEPFFLQWHLTDRCNLACRHCYRGEGKSDLGLEILQAILTGYVDFLRQRGRQGRIQFSGGEPLLSPHLYELIRTAKTHQIPSRVLTNGTVVTPKSARKLRQVGCRLAQVSLDGLESTHDKIRGPGTFQQAVAGIRALRKAGIEVSISMTLSRINVAEAVEVARLANQIADRVHFSRLVPVGSGQTLMNECLSSVEMERVMAGLFTLRENKEIAIDFPLRDPLWKAFFNPHPCNCIAGCAAGYNGLTIEANGDVYPCRRLPVVVGNICQHSLEEIWHTPLMQALRDRDRLGGKCGECRLRWLCGGCRGIAYAISEDPLAEDPQCFRHLTWGEKLIAQGKRFAHAKPSLQPSLEYWPVV